MSDAVLIALIGGVPLAMGQAAAIIVSLRNGRKTDAGVAAITVKTDTIAASVNGAATEQRDQITAMHATIAELHQAKANQDVLTALKAQP